MPRRTIAILLIGGILPVLAGCADMGGPSNANDPNYALGHSDGCWASTSGKREATRNKDLYNSSDAYRAGWRAGFNSCRVDSGAQRANDPVNRPSTSPFGY